MQTIDVVLFPGLNCELDARAAVRQLGGAPSFSGTETGRSVPSMP